ncbi:serine/threonine-protein kinase [bacterium]|nr:serine/threonine-protein kinase [bacterium]
MEEKTMIGKTISHYKIIEKLGEGGMGVVYKAQDTKLDRLVALKFLPVRLTASETDKARFLQEAKAASAINHPNVCVIHDIQEHDDHQFIVMEYVEGRTLRDVIYTPLSPPSRGDLGGCQGLPLKEAIEYAIQIAEALEAAHEQSIIHRDIKSENIMINTKNQIKVMDFGLAKLKGALKLTKTSSTVGTLAYSSPEQIQGQEVDARSDIFSFGVVLYEMITGHLPFRGEYESAMVYSILNEEPEPIQKHLPEISSEIVHILLWALEKSPEERYQSIHDILIDLRRVKKETLRVFPAPKISVTKAKVLGAASEKEKTLSAKSRKLLTRPVFWIPLVLVIIFILVGYFISQSSKKTIPIWMQQDTPLNPLTSEPGCERGNISPDGHYLVYENGRYEIILKELSTGETTKIAVSEPGMHYGPVWSPDGTRIAFIIYNHPDYGFVICSAVGNVVMRRFETTENPYSLSWSPDGLTIACLQVELSKLLILQNLDGTMKKYPLDAIVCQSVAWSPDSKKIAFIEERSRDLLLRYEKKHFGVIRILDTENGVISDSLKGVKAHFGGARAGGVTWSRDGHYLVYVGYDGINSDLFALPMKSDYYSVSGPPICIRKFTKYQIPLRPVFTKDEQQLSFGINEYNRDIYFMSIDIPTARISGEPKPIATDRRIDDEPCWTPDGSGVVFVSEREDQKDLYRFSLENNTIKRLTFTEQEEQNPQFTPDGKSISFYSNEAIWSIPSEGGSARHLTPDDLKLLNNYIWSRDSTILFVTTIDNSDVRYMKLIQLDLKTGTQEVLRGMLRDPGLSLSPDGSQLIVSGVDLNNADGSEKIVVLDIQTKTWNTLEKQLAYNRYTIHGRFSFSHDGQYILNEWLSPTEEIFVELLPVNGSQPKSVQFDQSHFPRDIYKDIFIGQIDPSGKRVLITVYSEEADMWVLGNK